MTKLEQVLEQLKRIREYQNFGSVIGVPADLVDEILVELRKRAIADSWSGPQNQ